MFKNAFLFIKNQFIHFFSLWTKKNIKQRMFQENYLYTCVCCKKKSELVQNLKDLDKKNNCSICMSCIKSKSLRKEKQYVDIKRIAKELYVRHQYPSNRY